MTAPPRPRLEALRRFGVRLGIVAVAAAIAWSLVAGERSGPPEGQTAPDFTADRLEGGPPFRLADARGRVVLLDFWATWCPPCRRSLPALQAVHRRYRESPDVLVLSVNTDAGPDREALVRRFMAGRDLDFPVLLDRGRISAAYRVRSVPTTVVVGPDGVVREVEVGVRAATVDGIADHFVEMIEAARAPKG